MKQSLPAQLRTTSAKVAATPGNWLSMPKSRETAHSPFPLTQRPNIITARQSRRLQGEIRQLTHRLALIRCTWLIFWNRSPNVTSSKATTEKFEISMNTFLSCAKSIKSLPRPAHRHSQVKPRRGYGASKKHRYK